MNDTQHSAEVLREIEAVRKAAERAVRDPDYTSEPHLTLDRHLRDVLREEGLDGPTVDDRAAEAAAVRSAAAFDREERLPEIGTVSSDLPF